MSDDAHTLVGWFQTRELAEQARQSLGCDSYSVRFGLRHPMTGDFVAPEQAHDPAEVVDPLMELSRYLFDLRQRALDELERQYGPLMRADGTDAREAFYEASLVYIERYQGAFLNMFLDRFAPMLSPLMRDELCEEVIRLAAQRTIGDAPREGGRSALAASNLLSREQRLRDMLVDVTNQLSAAGPKKPWWKRLGG